MQTTEPHVSHSAAAGLPVRIAFCITDLDPGGAEKALLQIVSRLDRSEWEPAVYCLGPEAELTARFREQGIPTVCYGARGARDWGVIPWLSQKLKTFQPALLQTFLFHANLAGRFAGRMAGVPVIIAGHRVAERQKRWHLTLERWTRRWCDYHVCVSAGVARHLEREARIPPGQISVIGNGVEVPLPDPAAVDLRQQLDFPRDAEIVLGIGRLHPQKDFAALIRIFGELSQTRPAARLVIVGEGPLRAELTRQIDALNMQSQVRLIGYRRDIFALLRQSQVLAVTSRWEGMSNAMLEAAAVGLPVVTRPVEGLDELTEIWPSQIVVSSDSDSGFAADLATVLNRRPGAGPPGEIPQVLSKEYVRWDRVVRDYVELYRHLNSRSQG